MTGKIVGKQLDWHDWEMLSRIFTVRLGLDTLTMIDFVKNGLEC